MLTEGWDARNVTHIFGYRAFGSQLLCEQVTGRALRKTAFSGRDEKQPIEYANLFGVPFAWPGGKTPGTPPVPVEPQDVYTLPGREHLRLRFPHLAGYAHGGGTPRWSIDPRDAPRCRVAPRGPLIGTSVEGPLGEPILVPRRPEEERTALWKAAAQLVPKLECGVDVRRQAFLDALAILDVCQPNLDCEDWTDLQFDGDTLHTIASRVRRVEGEPSVGAVFEDQREPGSVRTSDTGSVRFRTTLRYWYDGTTKSELNAAACHSSQEAELAEVLDRHPDIEAWVRNFRLGWTVPWYDSGNACWSRTEPDFVARSKTLTPDGRSRYLVIEFKGMLAGEASEEQKAPLPGGALGARRDPAACEAALVKATTTATGGRCGSRTSKKRVSRSRGLVGFDRAARVEQRRERRGERLRMPTKPRPYEHSGAKRRNIPTDRDQAYVDELRERIPFSPEPAGTEGPRLSWRRGAGAQRIETDAMPLYIHEKVSPAAFVEQISKEATAPGQGTFFDDFNGLPPDARYDWYRHEGNWQNRIIRGNSVEVMASLAQKEGMAGQVQLIYFDPPYGIGFKGNYQGSTRKRTENSAPVESASRRAFRDTYVDGRHSYMDTVFRIAVHARALLRDSGSFFLQIGTENVHRLSVLLDEVFEPENRVATIAFAKSGATSARNLPQVADWLLWYAKDRGPRDVPPALRTPDTEGEVGAHVVVRSARTR